MSQTDQVILEDSNDRFGRLGKLSIEQYHDMIRAGILGPSDPFELLEGILVRKMPKDPLHEAVIGMISDLLYGMKPPGCIVSVGGPVTTQDSEPEPDLRVAAGSHATYLHRHPSPAETHLIVEVANTSLLRDRGIKLEIYARGRCPIYWIVNLAETTIEVHSLPHGGPKPGYAQRTVYTPGQRVPVIIDGATVGEIAVDDLFPPKP